MSEGLRLKAPDPARAHGAWVYLFTSILAGMLAAAGFDFATALVSGLGFVGVFVMASAAANYPRRWKARSLSGLAVTVVCIGSGLALGANPMFLAYGAIAVPPAAAAAWFAARYGFRSPPALAFGVVALVVAAPAAACAGGAPHWLGLLLLGLLAPFFAWRTWRTRTELSAQRDWTRARLRALGWREAAFALGWTAFALAVVHVVGRLK